MGNNASVRRFKTDMQELSRQMAQNFQETLKLQAQELAGDIQRAIPHSVSGHLRDSVRIKDVSRRQGDMIRPSVLVLAGGPLTTRRTASGHSADYALFEEFGTSKEEARPFFYSTVRRYKAASVLNDWNETFGQTIAENNKIRAIRANNEATLGQTASYRGAVTIKR